MSEQDYVEQINKWHEAKQNKDEEGPDPNAIRENEWACEKCGRINAMDPNIQSSYICANRSCYHTNYNIKDLIETMRHFGRNKEPFGGGRQEDPAANANHQDNMFNERNENFRECYRCKKWSQLKDDSLVCLNQECERNTASSSL